MKPILHEPDGTPITVLDVLLYNQWRHKRKCKDDTMFIIYKTENHEKKIRSIKNPEIDIFFVKPEYRNDFLTSRENYPIENCYSKTVTNKNLLSTIYKEMEQSNDPVGEQLKRIYIESQHNGNFRAKKEIFKWPYVLMADNDIPSYYWIMMGYKYNLLESHTFNRAYLDIESAIYGLTSTEQRENLDPTNACTVIFNYDQIENPGKSPEVYTFLLRNYELYKQQPYFEEHLPEFIQQCHDEFDHQVVTKDGSSKTIDMVADYHIILYDNEGEMITAIFDTINQHKPDTLSVWNIAYDIPKLAARLEKNGLDYVDIMSDKDFPADCRYVDMHIDDRAAVDIADRKTFIKMTSTTLYIDQMQSYAGLRKGGKAYGPNKLDNIAKIELGVGKREFAPGIDVTNAPIKDYWNFILYNITDVWRQVLVDEVTQDSMAMIYDMNQMNCPMENLTKQTKYQKQIYYAWYLRKGVVPGNNINVSYINGETEEYLEKIEELKNQRKLREELDELYDADDIEDDNVIEIDPVSDNDILDDIVNSANNIFNDSTGRKLTLPGGLVGNPDHNIANGTEMIDGVFSKHVYDEVMDMDYSAEYPWAKYTRSVSRSTQIGRLIIEDKVSDRQNALPLGLQKRIQDINSYLPGAEFTADYISGDIISFCNSWFNLPSVVDANELLEKYLGEY